MPSTPSHPPLSSTSISVHIYQWSGDRWGVPFLRFIMESEISETGLHAGLNPDGQPGVLLLFFLPNSVVAVQLRFGQSINQAAPPLLEPDSVLIEPAGSSTESGVICPSSKPPSGKARNSQLRRYMESLHPVPSICWSCGDKIKTTQMRKMGNKEEQVEIDIC